VTAVLAAVARAVLGAVLLLAVVASMLWARFGPQGWPLVAWLVAVCAAVVGAGLCASALHPETEETDECDQDWLRGAATWVPDMADEEA
jgi:hypothetical protein